MSDPQTEVAATCLAVGKRATNGELTLKEFNNLWPLEADKDNVLFGYMNGIEHFLIDEEIRAKDASYEMMQRRGIDLLAAKVSKKYGV